MKFLSPLLLLLLLLLAAWVSAKAEEVPIRTLVATRLSADGQGRVSITNDSGAIIRQFTGLSLPYFASLTAQGSLLVLDWGLRKIIEISMDGRVLASAQFPSQIPGGRPALSFDGHSFLVTDGRKGLIEFDRSGRVIRRIVPPKTVPRITSAVALNDEAILTAANGPERCSAVFHLFRDDLFQPITRDPQPDSCQPDPRIVAVDLKTGTFASMAYIGPFLEVFRLDGLAAESLGRYPKGNIVAQHGDRKGNLVWSNTRAEVSRLSEDKLTKFRFNYPIYHVWHDRHSRQYVIAHRFVPDHSWPGSKPIGYFEFPWKSFWPWPAAAAVFLFWIYCLARRAETRGSLYSALPQHGVAELQLVRPMLATALLFLMSISSLALYRAIFSTAWEPDWLTPALVLISIIVGLVLGIRAWRRPDPIVSCSALRFARGVYSVQGLTVLCTLLGSTLLYWWSSGQHDYVQRVGLWSVNLILATGLVVLPDRHLGGRLIGITRLDILICACLVAGAAFLLGYRLSEIPVNQHFDFTFYGRSALDLLEGRQESIWSIGFVPVPVAGLLPEVLSLSLFGVSPLGFRAGAVVVGLTTPLAVYLIGRLVGGRSLGFFAALLLIGNIQFIYYNRLNTTGETLAAATWALSFFLLAVYTGRPRWWAACGLACGWCYYVWPISRVATFALALTWLLVLLRHPRRAMSQWWGPLLLLTAAFAVLAPVLPTFFADRTLLFARAQASLEIYKPLTNTFNWDYLDVAFGEPLKRSLLWFFTDRNPSTHHSGFPGLNQFESAIFLFGGLVFVTFYRQSLLLLIPYFVLFILVGGAFAAGEMLFYTRLLPTLPIAVLAMAAALITPALLFSRHRLVHQLLLTAAAAAVICSTVVSFRDYVQLETGASGRNHMWVMTGIGRALRKLPTDYRRYLVGTGRSYWSLNYLGRSRGFGQILPHIGDLTVSEIRDLNDYLPFRGTTPVALVLQKARGEVDFGLVQHYHPRAERFPITAGGTRVLAWMVVIKPLETDRNKTTDDLKRGKS